MAEYVKRKMRVVAVDVDSEHKTYDIVLNLKDKKCMETVVLPTFQIPNKINISTLVLSVGVPRPIDLKGKDVCLYIIDGKMAGIGPADKDEVISLAWSPVKAYTEREFWLEADIVLKAEEIIAEHGGKAIYC